MGHTHTLNAKFSDFAPIQIGVKEARDILAKVPYKSLRGLNYGLIKEIRDNIRAGKWPTDHILSFERDGTLFRGLNLIYAVATCSDLKGTITVMAIIPTEKNDPSARQEAIKNKTKRYFTGKPCKRGHVAERLTSCGRCIVCHHAKKHRADKKKAEGKKWRIKKYGFDPNDLRYQRKRRGIIPSDKPSLVRLREKRKLLGRPSRAKKAAQAEAHQDT